MEEDFYEDDLYGEEERPSFDLDLLLSVAGGLGRYISTEDGRRVYEKDPDCLGEPLRAADPAGPPAVGARGGRTAARRAAQASRPRSFDMPAAYRTGHTAVAMCHLPWAPAWRTPTAPSPAWTPPETPSPPLLPACLKDLQRFLRRDDPENRDAFFKLGELTLAASHLVPLLVTYPGDEDLALNAREARGPRCCAMADAGRSAMGRRPRFSLGRGRYGCAPHCCAHHRQRLGGRVRVVPPPPHTD
jgi:hypothetical protein